MRRREFIALTGGAVAASSFTAARAQQRATPVIGFLNGSSATAYATYVQAFIHGLAETGYTVGEMLRSNTAGPRVNTIASPIWLKTSCVVGLLSLPRTRRQRTLQKAPLVASRLSFLPERIQSRAASWQARRQRQRRDFAVWRYGSKASRAFTRASPCRNVDRLSCQSTQSDYRAECNALDAMQKLGKKIEIVHASSEAEIDVAFDTLRSVRATRC